MPRRPWRQWNTDTLTGLLNQLDDSTEEWEQVKYELDMRVAAAEDSRVGQAIGANPNEQPS